MVISILYPFLDLAVLDQLEGTFNQITIESEVYEATYVLIDRAIERALDRTEHPSQLAAFIVDNHLKRLNPKTVRDSAWREVIGVLEMVCYEVSNNYIYWCAVVCIENRLTDNILQLNHLMWDIESKPESVGEVHVNLSQFCAEIWHRKGVDNV